MFDTRAPAPLSVRWARVIVPLFLLFAYMVFRVYPAAGDRIPLGELLSAGSVFVGLTLVACAALGDLIAPRLGVGHLLDAMALELTAEHAPVVTDIDAAIAEARGRFAGQLPFDGPASNGVRLRAIAEAMADTEELELLTHAYVPLHHTPARGIPVIEVASPTRPAQPKDAQLIAAFVAKINGGLAQPPVRFTPSPHPRNAPGRHRLNPARSK